MPDTTADKVSSLEARIRRDRWLNTMRGGFPQVPVRDVLPTADAGYRFQLLGIRGATGAADTVYCCLKDAAEAYAWEVVATG